MARLAQTKRPTQFGQQALVRGMRPLIAALLMSAGAEGQEAGLVIMSLPPKQAVLRGAEGAAEVIRAMPGPDAQLTPIALAPMSPMPPMAALAEPQPRRAGLPQPSVIIGDLAVLRAFGSPGPLGMPFDQREAIRMRDPALFQRLLGSGRFDPQPEALAEAVQTELQRMACYAGPIDGAWGAGSARGVAAWRAAAGSPGARAAPVGADPDMGLFRALLQSGDLRCAGPAPTAPTAAAVSPRTGPAAQARSTGARASGTSSGTSAPRATRSRGPAAGTAQPQQPTRQINPSMIGSGMFR